MGYTSKYDGKAVDDAVDKLADITGDSGITGGTAAERGLLIRERTDTLNNWIDNNPILALNEKGYISILPGAYKLGDGITTWKELYLKGVINKTFTKAELLNWDFTNLPLVDGTTVFCSEDGLEYFYFKENESNGVTGQFKILVEIVQELGESDIKLISQSATTKFIKETQGYLNIDLLVPLPTGQYYDLASAIQVIPANLRVPGCSIVFAINPYFEFQYYKYNHISVSAGWDNLKNWTPQNIGIYSSFIDYNVLLQYPRLSCIKSIKIENLAKENKNDDFYLLAMSQGNIEEQTLALGVNKIVNAEGVKIIKCTLTGIVINNDYSNVKFTGTYNAATIEIICDRSRFIANTNVQDQGEPWILLNSITRILKDSDDGQSLIINVSTEYPLPDGEFYTAVTARAAVTAEKRKNGLILQWISGLYDAFSYQQYTVKTNEFSDSVWNLPQNWMPLSLGLNTPYFGFTDVGKYPELAIFKSIEIYNPNNIKLPEFYILSIGQGNIQEQQIVLNVDKEVNSEGLKIYGVILKSSKLEDKHNVEFVGNYQSATFRVICDRSIINSRSFQSPDNPFIRINNIKEIKRYSLSGDESLFVEGYSFSEKFGADFVLDAAFYMSKEDQENWTYYIKQVAVEYGESKENYINIERYNTETTADQLGNYYLNNIDSQGIATFIGTGTYGAHRNKLLAIRLKWNNAAVFKGTLYHDTATKAVFKDICFQGGLHTLDKYLPANRLRDFDNMPVGKYKVGTMDVFKKDDKAIPTYFYAPSYTFNEDCIQTIKNEKSYIIGQNQEPINKLKDLQYVDLGNRRLLDVSWDDKIWITDSSTKKLYYAQGVENAKADNWVEVNTPVNMPDGHYIGAMCMNNDGELIVVSYKALTQTNFSKIYKSDKNFTNWVEKQEFRSDATVEIPDWTLQQRGNRIIITGYGQHGTVPTEVAWYIYYSPDSGETWYDNLFNLGKLIDINLWEPDPALVSGMHIHGVGIDPYRGQLIVVSGDSSADIFYTTNLTEWEMNNDKTNNYLPSDSNALHWIRRPVMESMKYVNVYALNNALLLGSDALPNGIQRLNYTEEYPYLNENACTELKWAMQRNNGETGDYSFYGYTIARRSNNSPILCSMRYMGGVAESDHKRNMVFASWDGYNFSKIWEDNWDLTRELNGELIKLRNINHPVCRNDSYGNYIIQTSSDGTIGLVETYVLIISLNK